MKTMQALRIELVGDVTSFRYPHFMWGVQPTFDMPPPATIYGHICSAVGDWIDPAGLRFAYHFTHSGKFTDLEHIHAGGMPTPVSTRKRKELSNQGYHDITMYGESTVTPFARELLFRPRLLLYLNRLDLADAFRSPRYPVVLGRSQDLCTYPPHAIKVVTLEQCDTAYYEHTLLPLSMAARTRRGITVTMPRYVDYWRGRQPHFAQYLVLNERVVSNTSALQTFGSSEPIWCDPTVPAYKDHPRAVVWHTFTDNENKEEP
jgi:CRISPR-associated protein Cas5t